MRNIKHYLDVMDANRDIAICLMSIPGCSKTQQINQWAEEHDRRVVTYIVSQSMPTEVAGMAIPNSDTKDMTIYDFDKLMSLEDGDILFFDELTSANIQTVHAMLTLVESRMTASGKKLPDVLVVAAGNFDGSVDFTPQAKQRFIWISVQFDPACWSIYMARKYGYDPIKLMNLSDHVERKFERAIYNYSTPRQLEKYLNLTEQYAVGDSLWHCMIDGRMLPRHELVECIESKDSLRAQAFRALAEAGIGDDLLEYLTDRHASSLRVQMKEIIMREPRAAEILKAIPVEDEDDE